MESARFDALARRLAGTSTRRTALAALAAALGRLLPGTAAAQPRPPCRPFGGRCDPDRELDCCAGTTCRTGRCRCPEGKRRCQGACLDVRRCCGDQCPGGAVCREGRCVCPAGKKRCGGRCIPKAACCRDGECGPGGACAGGRCRCRAGFQPCQGGCIRDGACCGGCPANHVCRAGSCCIETTAALQAALAPGGPATIRLCPNTTYPGGFTIGRTVTIIGAGASSSLLNGGGTQRVVEVTGAGTQAELRGLGIANGQAVHGGGIFNFGQLTLTDVALTGNTATNSNGGGLFNGGTAMLTRCRIATNAARIGAGIANSIGSLTLFNCDLTGNAASQDSGGLYNSGGATLDNSRLTGNTAPGPGGGIYNIAGQLTLQNGTVVGGELPAEANQAGRGGGIYFDGSLVGGTVTVTASHVIGNVSTIVNAVGGIELAGGAPQPIIGAGSTVRDNTPCDCNFADAACSDTDCSA